MSAPFSFELQPWVTVTSGGVHNPNPIAMHGGHPKGITLIELEERLRLLTQSFAHVTLSVEITSMFGCALTVGGYASDGNFADVASFEEMTPLGGTLLTLVAGQPKGSPGWLPPLISWRVFGTTPGVIGEVSARWFATFRICATCVPHSAITHRPPSPSPFLTSGPNVFQRWIFEYKNNVMSQTAFTPPSQGLYRFRLEIGLHSTLMLVTSNNLSGPWITLWNGTSTGQIVPGVFFVQCSTTASAGVPLLLKYTKWVSLGDVCFSITWTKVG